MACVDWFMAPLMFGVAGFSGLGSVGSELLGLGFYM